MFLFITYQYSFYQQHGWNAECFSLLPNCILLFLPTARVICWMFFFIIYQYPTLPTNSMGDMLNVSLYYITVSSFYQQHGWYAECFSLLPFCILLSPPTVWVICWMFLFITYQYPTHFVNSMGDMLNVLFYYLSVCYSLYQQHGWYAECFIYNLAVSHSSYKQQRSYAECCFFYYIPVSDLSVNSMGDKLFLFITY